MALRAFHSNPSLGGFGGESGGASHASAAAVSEKDCDAFAQIVKELVDNAVDACSKQQNDTTASAKRVRVVIERIKHVKDSHEEYSSEDSVLRVTISDNGCGMKDIQQCVDVFRTTKACNKRNTGADGNEDDIETSTIDVDHTAGRYGLGLTLCMLHAQRLVPDSCASIMSATAEQECYTRANYVVDKDEDSVRCVKREQLPKTSFGESGTAVSLLVPDGPTARLAWPRLAEYFARFQLSLKLKCSVEVLAPSLSNVPLFVRPPTQQGVVDITGEDEPYNGNAGNTRDDPQSDNTWMHGAVEAPRDEQAGRSARLSTSRHHQHQRSSKSLVHRDQVRSAVQSYLMRNVELKNVAHSTHPIGRGKRRRVTPTLEVSIIVYKPDQNTRGGSQNGSEMSDDECMSYCTSDSADDILADREEKQRHAKLSMIRMVNGVPLLDGAEAAACGLVQGICANQASWNAFGLHIAPTSEMNLVPRSMKETGGDNSDEDEEHSGQLPAHLFVPVYAVVDSDQVAPFFQHSVHALFENNESISDESSDDEGQLHSRARLLPAFHRLGQILVIVQICAEPASLPLPTLSKGRLPLNNRAIGGALELGITDCLRSLQVTNPELLLTSQQLKHTARDTRYIPAVSGAIASIVRKSKNAALQASLQLSIHAWRHGDINANDDSFIEEDLPQGARNADASSAAPELHALSATVATWAIEKRLRSVCCHQKRADASQSQRAQQEDRDHDEDLMECDDDEAMMAPDTESQEEHCVAPTNISEEIDSEGDSFLKHSNDSDESESEQGEDRTGDHDEKGDDEWW